MPKFTALSLLFCAAVVALTTTTASGAAEGLPPIADWITFAEFKEYDLLSNTKPICFFVHKSWCGACKNLKKSLNDQATQNLVKDAAKEFLMVSVTEDDEPTEGYWQRALAPESSTYVPRLIFADHFGAIQTQIKNDDGNPKYPYFYSTATEFAEGLSAAMKKVPKHTEL